MKIKNILYLFLIVALSACQEQDPDRKESTAFPVAGVWNVHLYWDEGTYGPIDVTIFNTANSKDSVWIKNIYDDGVLTKAKLTKSKTFDVAGFDLAEEDIATQDPYDKIVIENSKIVKTDSIYFEVTLYYQDNLYDQFYVAGTRWRGHDGGH